jgi:enoyl-[acyl-carrier-protein] reductase (NADH)
MHVSLDRAQAFVTLPALLKLGAELARHIPLGESVPGEDVAEAPLLLPSDRARAITGQALLLNGGEPMC